ncbi:hypothetical protein [Myxacorys almedinensis]|uniref:Uncharacterized protein n=1 Tax=Myxacorys almedinensis A TaxID=2690445 RepID=A0A8J7YYP2_9CYAN|nr:hypothetical protein [Myxacorys almedinensis]NDJ16994.1 hypothetical protein [Myxacorys almedinensis A]
MSHSIQRIVKLSGMLPILLGMMAFSPTKASALDVSQIPLLGSVLQRGLSIEPSVRLLDQGLSRNNVQLCVLSCSPLPNGIPPISSPPAGRVLAPGTGAVGGSLPQQMMQLPAHVLQQGMQIPNQILPSQSMPQPLPQGVPGLPQPGLSQPGQVRAGQAPVLQQLGQTLQPQIRQAIGR